MDNVKIQAAGPELSGFWSCRCWSQLDWWTYGVEEAILRNVSTHGFRLFCLSEMKRLRSISCRAGRHDSGQKPTIINVGRD